MCWNHPETTPPRWAMEKSSSAKLGPGANKVGDCGIRLCWFENGLLVKKKCPATERYKIALQIVLPAPRPRSSFRPLHGS